MTEEVSARLDPPPDGLLLASIDHVKVNLHTRNFLLLGIVIIAFSGTPASVCLRLALALRPGVSCTLLVTAAYAPDDHRACSSRGAERAETINGRVVPRRGRKVLDREELARLAVP